ncbi:MAG: hypothetical protein KJ572_09180 [Gammaproteobacteria bacterium]|nr:hypothetical protein [Gammaproteobacteria bacterium]MBU4046507.1 hypothetical protein [Gammaproteobacteria bacterium]
MTKAAAHPEPVMGESVLFLIVLLKALVEVAALSLLAQGILRVLAGRSYQQNPVYRLFQVIASPALWLGRVLTPRFIAQQYLGLIAFLLLFWMWLALIYAKAYVCHAWKLACFAA